MDCGCYSGVGNFSGNVIEFTGANRELRLGGFQLTNCECVANDNYDTCTMSNESATSMPNTTSNGVAVPSSSKL